MGAVSLPKSCKSKFFSASSLPSDPQELRTYVVLLQRYSTSRAALQVAATLEHLARKKRDTSGVRVGELSVMDNGEPSLVVETTAAGVRVVRLVHMQSSVLFNCYVLSLHVLCCWVALCVVTSDDP